MRFDLLRVVAWWYVIILVSFIIGVLLADAFFYLTGA